MAQEEDWGSLSVTMPVNTLVVATIIVSFGADGKPHYGTAVHVPDPEATDLAHITAAHALQRFADEMKANTAHIHHVSIPFQDDDEDEEG